jgi:hypothetical protein
MFLRGKKKKYMLLIITVQMHNNIKMQIFVCNRSVTGIINFWKRIVQFSFEVVSASFDANIVFKGTHY